MQDRFGRFNRRLCIEVTEAMPLYFRVQQPSEVNDHWLPNLSAPSQGLLWLVTSSMTNSPRALPATHTFL